MIAYTFGENQLNRFEIFSQNPRKPSTFSAVAI